MFGSQLIEYGREFFSDSGDKLNINSDNNRNSNIKRDDSFFSYSESIIFHCGGRLWGSLCVITLFLQQRFCRNHHPKKTDLPLWSFRESKSTNMHPILGSALNSTEVSNEEDVNDSKLDFVVIDSGVSQNTSSGSEPSLCATMIEYESFVVQGGRMSLAAWMEHNGVTIDEIELPPAIFSSARYSHTPIQYILQSDDDECRQYILHANAKLINNNLSSGFRNMSASVSETTSSVKQSGGVESSWLYDDSDMDYKNSLQTRDTKEIRSGNRFSEEKIESVKIDKTDTKIGTKSGGNMGTANLHENKQQMKKTEDYYIDAINKGKRIDANSGSDLHVNVQKKLHKHWIVWSSTPKWIPNDPEKLTNEQMVEIYEICYFLSYNMGIAWHPDVETLLNGETQSVSTALKSGGKECIKSIREKSSGTMHPVVFGVNLLSKDYDDRISVANACIRAGGTFFAGWSNWIDSGKSESQPDSREMIEKNIRSKYFGITDDDDDEMEGFGKKSLKSGGRAVSLVETIGILTNHAEMSLEDYRKQAPAFTGWLASLPQFPREDSEYREANMSKQEKDCVMHMGLFFCWLPLSVTAISDISKLDSYEFKKYITDANRRSIQDHITGMDSILQRAMRISNKSISERIQADAINQAMQHVNMTLRASYYVFSQKVCAAVSRFAMRNHIRHTICNPYSRGKEYAEKITSAQKMAGKKWSAVVSKV